MLVPIIVLLIVFLLIAVRQIGGIRLQIWQIMLFGALTVLITGQISVINALNSINLDIILFLFGMFVVGQALEESGYLSHLSYKIFKKAKSLDSLILFILFGVGIASAVLMNDTLAIIGTPVILLLSRKHGINPKIMLLALTFAVTIGSVMSPIGNPQNLLIALNSTIKNPFIIFLKFLFIPTVISLFLAYVILRLFYKSHFNNNILNHSHEPIKNHKLALLSKVSLMSIMILILAKITILFLNINFDFKLTYIALISSLPIVLLSRERFEIIKKIDWHTLIFFAAMFILMESVWISGFFQSIIERAKLDVSSLGAIFLISVILSQFISNVPLVALYLPLLSHTGASINEIMALAAGSTIAGNLSILGAASNVIIIQNAEKKANETITFWEFAKIGIPLTVLNIIVYWLFLF